MKATISKPDWACPLALLYKFIFAYRDFFRFYKIFSYCRFTPTSRLKQLCKDRDSRKRPCCKYFCNLLRCMSHTGCPKMYGKSTPPTLQRFLCARVWNREGLSFLCSAYFEQLTSCLWNCKEQELSSTMGYWIL